jgi:enamine deaminase RidA (YjgF/YER057c/UK114 family)
MQLINPSDSAAPASRFSHGVLVPANARRLVISGQVGMKPDGTIVEGLEAQLQQIWRNIEAVLRAGQMEIGDLVKLTAFVTDPKAVAAFRTSRDAFLKDHRPASTFLVVAGLAIPSLVVEVEAEAVRG